MRLPGDDEKLRDIGYFVAAEDVGQLREEAGPQIDRAVGVGWYEHPGSEIDGASLTLCRLRRARGGEKGGTEYGDEAVRQVLETVSTPALVWLASRAISYMDETGFPEAVELWFQPETRP